MTIYFILFLSTIFFFFSVTGINADVEFQQAFAYYIAPHVEKQYIYIIVIALTTPMTNDSNIRCHILLFLFIFLIIITRDCSWRELVTLCLSNATIIYTLIDHLLFTRKFRQSTREIENKKIHHQIMLFIASRQSADDRNWRKGMN